MRYLVKMEIAIQAANGSEALRTLEARLCTPMLDPTTSVNPAPLKQAEIIRATVSVEPTGK